MCVDYTLLYIVDELTSRRGNLFFLVDGKISFLVVELTRKIVLQVDE